MRTRLLVGALLACAVPSLLFADAKEARRLDHCREVVDEVMGIKEEIPRELVEKASCVIVMPGVKKGAVGVGGRFGYGAASCHSGGGPWSAPLMMSLKGGSVGFQIGGQEVDLILLVMNPKGIDYLLRSKFTLGADASVAAGPVGRTAEAATDAQMHAEMLSYSRARGVFVGASLEGSVVKSDEDANFGVYGEHVSPRDLLTKSSHPVPKAGQGFVDALAKYAPPK